MITNNRSAAKYLLRVALLLFLLLTPKASFGENPLPGFSVNSISDEIFARINGKSYKEGCPVSIDDLRYITVLHYDADGNQKSGELICHKEIADDLLDIFTTLYKEQYPIESVRLVDDFNADDEASMKANNTSCFNFRPIAGSKKLSKHAYGKAIDINPLYNPYVKNRKNGTTIVQPKEGIPYVDRNKSFPMKIDTADACYRAFTRHGFEWGGAWKSLKDYQHFEK